MELDEVNYAGFTAKINQLDEGIEVIYRDPAGNELDSEVFKGISHYSVKKEHIDSRLKHFWEHR